MCLENRGSEHEPVECFDTTITPCNTPLKASYQDELTLGVEKALDAQGQLIQIGRAHV